VTDGTFERTSVNALCAAALEYAARGWAVFPVHSAAGGRCGCGKSKCDKPGKHPRTEHGLSDASTNAEVIRAWWDRWPDANPAIATGPSGLVVVDIDPRHGGDESLANLECEHGRLPNTPLCLTGGGGSHLYFLAGDRPVRSRNGLAPGIDIKSTGGYVIGPPSRHVSGGEYLWDATAGRDDMPIAPLPAWLRDLVAEKRANGRGTDETSGTIPEGRRHDALVREAGRLRRIGCSESMIEAALNAMNTDRCHPQLAHDEVRSIARSAGIWAPGPEEPPPHEDADAPGGAAEPDAERGKERLPEDEDDRPSPDAPPKAATDGIAGIGASEQLVEGDDRFAFPRRALVGTFGDIAELLALVTGASLPHIFAATWAALGVCIGRARWGSWSGRVPANFYGLCLGPTGDHKTSAIDRVVELLPSAVRHVDGTTSDAGLFDTLDVHGGEPTLLHYDELGLLLKMIGIPGQMLGSMINRLWSAPARFERRLSSRNKDGGVREIERPMVSIIGATQIGVFWQMLEDPEIAIVSGFVNRLVPFVVQRGRSLPVTREPDSQHAAKIRAHLARLAAPPERQVTLGDRAEARWREFSAWHDQRIAEAGFPLADVLKRQRDHAARLALVLATDAGRTEVELGDLDVAFAVADFIEQSYRALLAGRTLGRGPDRAGRVEATCRSLLRRHPGRIYTARELMRSWPSHPPPDSRELRKTLAAMDDVQIVNLPGRQKAAYRFKLAQAFSPTSDAQGREKTEA
jgi:hypothetical protein